MDHAERTRWTRLTPTATQSERIHAAFRDPIRLTLVAAAALIVIGSFFSWIEVWLPYRGWFDISSFEGASDGGITLELGAVLFVLAWSERVTGSRLAVLVTAPLVLAIAAVLDLRVASDSAHAYLDSIAASGGHGYLLPGFWMTVGGATLGTLAGVVRIWRVRHQVRWAIGIRLGTAATVIGGLIGAIVGFFSGITFGEHMTANTIGGVTGSVLILFAIGFAFAGAWLGAWAGGLVGSVAQTP
jgi:hypothetical protein